MYGIEELRERLFDLGFDTDENEGEALARALHRAEQCVMNECCVERVPFELRFAALDLAAGEYLSNRLSSEDERGIKSVTEGDFSVTFKDETENEAVIDSLFASGREALTAFRRIKW